VKPAQGPTCFSWPVQHCVSLIIAVWDGEDHNETSLALKSMMDRQSPSAKYRRREKSNQYSNITG